MNAARPVAAKGKRVQITQQDYEFSNVLKVLAVTSTNAAAQDGALGLMQRSGSTPLSPDYGLRFSKKSDFRTRWSVQVSTLGELRHSKWGKTPPKPHRVYFSSETPPAYYFEKGLRLRIEAHPSAGNGTTRFVAGSTGWRIKNDLFGRRLRQEKGQDEGLGHRLKIHIYYIIICLEQF